MGDVGTYGAAEPGVTASARAPASERTEGEPVSFSANELATDAKDALPATSTAVADPGSAVTVVESVASAGRIAGQRGGGDDDGRDDAYEIGESGGAELLLLGTECTDISVEWEATRDAPGLVNIDEWCGEERTETMSV